MSDFAERSSPWLHLSFVVICMVLYKYYNLLHGTVLLEDYSPTSWSKEALGFVKGNDFEYDQRQKRLLLNQNVNPSLVCMWASKHTRCNLVLTKDFLETATEAGDGNVAPNPRRKRFMRWKLGRLATRKLGLFRNICEKSVKETKLSTPRPGSWNLEACLQ